MVAERPAAGALPKVVRLDIVAFGAERVVMVDVVHIRFDRMPWSFARHTYSSFLLC